MQGSACTAPSFAEDILDEQEMTNVLARFVVSADEQERMVKAWIRYHERADGSAQVRARIDWKLVRLKEVYLEGDLDKDEYQRRRADLLAESAALPSADAPSSDVARQLAAFLGDLPSAWAVATPEERNLLARQLFTEAVIENRTVVTVKPRPELRPFFVNLFIGGSDGDRLLEIDVVTAPLVPFLYPERLLRSQQRTGNGRYSAISRGSRIPKENWAMVAAQAQTVGLRATARMFGVSHETVRTVVRHERSASS